MISIIIPTYNREKSIMRAVNSILNQSYKDFELIIVDDNSIDNTEKLINSINDSRIQFYKLEQNKGACYARNFGIKKANGDYIAFQDSDDFWYPEKLERQMEAFEVHREYDMVYCSFKRNYGRSPIVPDPKIKKTSGQIFHSLVKGNFIGTITILCKKKVLEDIGGFDEAFPAMQDWEIALRLASHYKIYHLQEVLVEAEISEDSITRNTSKLLKAIELLMQKYEGRLLKSEINLWKFKMANIAYRGGEKDTAVVLFKSLMNFYTLTGLLSIKKYLKITLNYKL